jgi:hypothetical protein
MTTEERQASHKMPAGIKRVEKGMYRTLDGRHEIRQYGRVWRLIELLGDSQVGLGEFPNRGAAVAKLAEDGKLPAEQPVPQQPAEAEKQPEQPVKKQPARPRTRKPVKEAAKV